MTTVHCVDCRHYVQTERRQVLIPIPLHWCGRPRDSDHVDIVTGRAVTTSVSAHVERARRGFLEKRFAIAARCGPEAQYFEPKLPTPAPPKER